MKKVWANRDYFTCDCGSESLACEAWEEDQWFYFSFWKHGHGKWEFSWRDRLRAVWSIIKDGHPYTDSIILNREDAVELATSILEKQKDWNDRDEGPSGYASCYK